eukprot:Skav204324  [mRNA]  locus=scaffold660:126071:128421:+ [translate_table: standard]
MSKPGWCAARHQDSNRSIPPAVLKSSFSELLNPHGLLVHIFVSHFWGHLYSSTLLALQLWATKHFPNFAQHPHSVVCWICLFALNQHAVADEVGQHPMQGPFNAALAQAAGGAVMVLQAHLVPFRNLATQRAATALRADMRFGLIVRLSGRGPWLTSRTSQDAASDV